MDNKPIQFTYFGSPVNFYGFKFSKYTDNDRLAVLAVIEWLGPDMEVTEPIEESIISVNLVDAPEPPEGQWYHKSYSEKEELSQFLYEQGLIETTVENAARSGYVSFPLVRLTDKGKGYIIEDYNQCACTEEGHEHPDEDAKYLGSGIWDCGKNDQH